MRTTGRRPTNGIDLGRTWIVQLERQDYTDEEQRLHDIGLAKAKRKRKHKGGTWKVDSFRLREKEPYRAGDRLIMVTTEPDGRAMVDPPAVVLGAMRYRLRGRFVYVELPRIRRKSVTLLARQIGGDAERRLMRGGRVSTGAFLEKLLRAFKI